MQTFAAAGVAIAATALASLAVRIGVQREVAALRAGRAPFVDAKLDVERVAALRLPWWLLVAALALGTIAGVLPAGWPGVLTVVVLTICAYTDARSFRIFDLVLALMVPAAIAAVVAEPLTSVAGVAVLGGSLVAASVFRTGVQPAAGDFKLAALVGAVYGYFPAFLTVEIAIVGVVILALRARARRRPAPGVAFAPLLALGAVVSLDLVR